jgi:dCTP diphosphatase
VVDTCPRPRVQINRGLTDVQVPIHCSCMAGVELDEMRHRIRTFAAEREWDQFHDPKNLVMALGGEVGELTELFQWLSTQESVRAMEDAGRAEAVRDELADILYYLIRLSDVLDVDLPTALQSKLAKNEKKYPIQGSRGNARKYTDLVK